MNLNPDAWYTRYFFWSADFITMWHDGWKDHNRPAHYYKTLGTNLCQFLRMTLLWPPAIILANIFVYGLWIYTVFIYPFVSFGFMSVLGFVIQVVIGAAVLVLFAFGLNFMPWRKFEKVKTLAEKAKVTTGVFLITTWVKDRHDKICRMISFKQENPNASV